MFVRNSSSQSLYFRFILKENQSIKILNQLTHFGFGLIISIVGALPFGLVNLSVLDAAYKDNSKRALQISHGAAMVEVLFGLIALYTGSLISQYINENLSITINIQRIDLF